jgi:NAD(P)-dependent dehydrogenase (short-subunit alcohol dehydrogenase family)
MKDKVVLITGGAGNLGRVVTRAFLEAGALVSVPLYKTDTSGALDSLPAKLKEKFHTFSLDLTTERGADQAVKQVVEWGGSLHGVVHLVGGYSGGTLLADTPLETWTRMIDLNLTSAYLVSRFAIPAMLARGGGSLVFISSRAAFQGRATHAAYSTSKAGLTILSKAIAEEYGTSGIRSNVVVPDSIDTAANRRSMPDADRSRLIEPEEVARVILFLSSGDAAAVNGAEVPLYQPG